MRVIGQHQNRPVQASELTRFRVSNQHMLPSLPPCAGKLHQNLVNLLAYAGQLWMRKFTRLCGSVLMQVTRFFSECLFVTKKLYQNSDIYSVKFIVCTQQIASVKVFGTSLCISKPKILEYSGFALWVQMHSLNMLLVFQSYTPEIKLTSNRFCYYSRYNCSYRQPRV